jgi:hypothetical protein
LSVSSLHRTFTPSLITRWRSTPATFLERYFMRRTALFLTAAALMVGAANLSAQGTSFAGTWTPVVDPNAAPAGGGRGMGGGGPMTITQDAKTMTISRSFNGTEMKSVYNLDGSDSKNTGMGRGGNPGMETISNAKWDGAKLVISTPRTGQDGTVTTSTATYWMDGGKLMVANTRPGRNGGEPTTTTTTYTKG